MKSNEYDGSGNAVQRTEHKYDAYNRLKSQAWTVGSTAYSESYTYDDPNAAAGKTSGDGSLLKMTTATGATIDFSYDNLKRLNQETVKSGSTTVMTTAYAYRTVSGNRSSAQIEYRNVRSNAGTLLEGKKYTYDALGNITMISQSTGSYYPLVAYEYDAQNQLVKETYYDGNGAGSDNVTATYTYTYDTAGNILSETKKTGSTTSTKTYTYSNSQWNDLLTAVNGSSISYDASGNPMTYRNGAKTYTSLTWKNGRQLTSLTTGGKTTSYVYDADGIRTKKTVGTEAHTYVTQNGKVIRETIGTGSSAKVLDFIYDESGAPFALKYSTNGGSSFTTYYYVVNLQGDVVKLVTANGTSVAEYTYNAWGEVLTATGEKASVNPLRYRGYYCDTETGFYYLQSRYYDPVTHRFINADAIASTGQGFTGTNMFAYCNNNPVVLRDSTGNEPVETIDLDGDGDIDCYVYEYSYSGEVPVGMGMSGHMYISGSGKIYIYKDTPESYFSDPDNRPEGFTTGSDFMVADFTNSNPSYDQNIRVIDSYHCTTKVQMRAIAIVLREYAASYAPLWDRSENSLVTEWVEHNRYALFSERARHVDFNNFEEGKGFWYFLGKAIGGAFDKFAGLFS